MNKKAIIIGASSGIGKELALLMLKNNWEVGITARRKNKLKEIKNKFPKSTHIQEMDITEYKKAITQIIQLIRKIGRVDVIIIAAGIGFTNKQLKLKKQINTINTNVTGFTALTNTAIEYFISKKKGHLVAISSIAAIRGDRHCPSYSASKAYESNYLEGIRQGITHQKLDITITEIQPGYVDTKLIDKGDNIFWLATPKTAAKQIYQAILKKKDHIYITKRWRLIAWALKIIPSWLHKRM